MGRVLILLVGIQVLILNSIAASPVAGHQHHSDFQVVYAGKHTIDATRYYQRITVKADAAERIREGWSLNGRLEPGRSEPVSLQEMFPIETHSMVPGEPRRFEYPYLYQPFFVVGIDDLSLAWMREHYRILSEAGAYGIVVQAADWQQWLEVKAEAQQQGITLMLLQGEPLTAMYGITEYPALVTSKGSGG